MSQLDNWLHDTRDFLKSEGIISCLYGNNFFQDHIMTDVDMVALIDERYETLDDYRPMLADDEELGEDFTDEEDADDDREETDYDTLEEDEDDFEEDEDDFEEEEDEDDEDDDVDWEDSDDDDWDDADLEADASENDSAPDSSSGDQ